MTDHVCGAQCDIENAVWQSHCPTALHYTYEYHKMATRQHTCPTGNMKSWARTTTMALLGIVFLAGCGNEPHAIVGDWVSLKTSLGGEERAAEGEGAVAMPPTANQNSVDDHPTPMFRASPRPDVTLAFTFRPDGQFEAAMSTAGATPDVRVGTFQILEQSPAGCLVRLTSEDPTQFVILDVTMSGPDEIVMREQGGDDRWPAWQLKRAP